MIILKNRGEIDLDVMKIMGVNIKGCESPIGKFGTGLKYAIAVFLREEIDLCLYVGRNRYEFYTEPRQIRGKTFQICQMKGPFDVVELPFTTDLGSGWEPWQAYRELRSNCIDEGGEVFTEASVRGEDGYTTFCIGEIDTQAVFLQDRSPKLLFNNSAIEIYEGESEHIYYRGIRAKDLNVPSLYTYNVIQDCKLTEDRLLCYDWQVEHVINESIVRMQDSGIIKNVITATRGHFEATLDMLGNNYHAPGQTFLETYRSVGNIANSRVSEYVAAHTPKTPPSRAQLRAEMLSGLDDFCRNYGLDYDVEDDSIRITGDLISDTELAA